MKLELWSFVKSEVAVTELSSLEAEGKAKIDGEDLAVECPACENEVGMSAYYNRNLEIVEWKGICMKCGLKLNVLND